MEETKFIVKAKKETYAKGAAERKYPDGAKELTYEEDGYLYADKYYGFDPFVGEEIVRKNGKTIWAMNYIGYLTDRTASSKEIYAFLKQALSKIPDSIPYRGPEKYKIQGMDYSNIVIVQNGSFTGEEQIRRNGKLVYSGHYHGCHI